VIQGQSDLKQGQTDLFNIVKSLLIDHEKQKNEAREKDHQIQRMHGKSP
jgi:predicted nucleotidyltransferase